MENREAYAQKEVILKALTRSNRNGEQHDLNDRRNLIFQLLILGKIYEYGVFRVNMETLKLRCQKNGKKKGALRCPSTLLVRPKNHLCLENFLIIGRF